MNLAQIDRETVWHPYSQHGRPSEFLPVKSAYGSTLLLEDGKTAIDAISSWWVNIHGHGHPSIVKAIADQAATLDHIIFAGFTHAPAVKLAKVLVDAAQRAGTDCTRAFYSDNGSTAVEVALKMAYQFHFNRGEVKRTRFLALRGSYHGDTLGTMSVGEPEGFHTLFKPLFADVDFVEPGDFEGLQHILHEHGNTIAAFIFEPLLQGASGMRAYSREFLVQATEACTRAGIVNIADEVFTGFYRTGKLFAFEHAHIKPDLICVSKGITGGTLPLAVTFATDRIYEAFLDQDIRKAFLHGHSYTANPIACAAALASWDLLNSEACQTQIRKISFQTEALLSPFATHPKVKSIRQLGTVGAVELHSTSDYFNVDSVQIMRFAIERGVLLRPLGRVLYTVPPYCISSSELKLTYETLGEIIHEFF